MPTQYCFFLRYFFILNKNIILYCPECDILKCTYMSRALFCSFCRSQTNSLYLLLTQEVFFRKHILLVYNQEEYIETNVHIGKRVAMEKNIYTDGKPNIH